jgi:hypothetical protein
MLDRVFLRELVAVRRTEELLELVEGLLAEVVTVDRNRMRLASAYLMSR